MFYAKFREIRTHDKKHRKALSKKNEYRAERLDSHRPTYTLDRLVKERLICNVFGSLNCQLTLPKFLLVFYDNYLCLTWFRYPTFIDALRDLDDCLTMIHLFAAMPAVERIDVRRIHNCKRFVFHSITISCYFNKKLHVVVVFTSYFMNDSLPSLLSNINQQLHFFLFPMHRLSHEWQAYISRTHSLRKTFISVKGIFYQVDIVIWFSFNFFATTKCLLLLFFIFQFCRQKFRARQ